MSKLLTFITGIITGIYIKENYRVPKLKDIYSQVDYYLEKYKKKE